MLKRLKRLFFILLPLTVILLSVLFGCNSSCNQEGSYTTYRPDSIKFINSVSHRGYYTAPENTLSAFKESAKQGFTMVECDVQFTSDDVPVIIHDDTIDRTSNGTGRVDCLTFDEIRTYDFGSWKSKKYAGEKIPSFEDLLLLCRNISLHPYIDIKESLSKTQIEILVQTVIKYGMKERVTWVSFDEGVLKSITELDDCARVGYNVCAIGEDTVERIKDLDTGKNSIFFSCYYEGADSAAIDLCIKELIPLEVWPIDRVEDLLNLHPYISGVTSDYLVANKILYDLYIN